MDGVQTAMGSLDPGHFAGVALALAIGLLVGVQRGWVQREAEPGSRFAGIRTFGLLGMAGGIAGTLYEQAHGPATVLLAAAALLVLFGYQRARPPANISGTASIAALLTLASGFMAGSGERILGSAVAVAMVLLLIMRERLHGWISRLSEGEVLAIARFALIAMVILPLLPDKGYGPYEAWNPRQLWLVVVLVSGFSFLGYFGTKILGAGRGTIAAAAAGSIVSSTAVTVSLATRLREDANRTPLNAAICMASLVMMLRVLALVALLAPFALAPFVLLVTPALLASMAPALWHMRRMEVGEGTRDEGNSAAMRLRNPFDIAPALLLAALVMATTVAAQWVMAHYGNAGLATVLAISGSVDVDSAIITMGTLPAGAIAPRMAAAILMVPVVLNSIFKGGLALAIAGWRKGHKSALPLFGTAIIGLLSAISAL